MISYVSGNLFKDKDVDAFAHGCNCAGAMGKGIALTFKEKYPEMYQEYKSRCLSNKFKVGDVFFWKDEKIIFNLGTQHSWRTKATLKAIDDSFAKMKEFAIKMHVKKIGMPKIGAGLGGLNWDDVKVIIEKCFKDSTIDIIVYERFIE